jgi:hypothetical protein
MRGGYAKFQKYKIYFGFLKFSEASHSRELCDVARGAERQSATSGFRRALCNIAKRRPPGRASDFAQRARICEVPP